VCGAVISKGMIVSVPWIADLEDRNAGWMEDELLNR
jgi:hypothetical protein